MGRARKMAELYGQDPINDAMDRSIQGWTLNPQTDGTEQAEEIPVEAADLEEHLRKLTRNI